jgi:hypothetical protein
MLRVSAGAALRLVRIDQPASGNRSPQHRRGDRPGGIGTAINAHTVAVFDQAARPDKPGCIKCEREIISRGAKPKPSDSASGSR